MRKKKIITGILILSMIASLAGCGKEAVSDGRGGYESKGIKESLSESFQNAEEPATTADSGSGNTASTPSDVSDADETERFHSYLDASFKEYAESDSLNFNTAVKDPATYGFTVPEATLGDAGLDEKDIEETKKECKDDAAELAEYDRSLLSPDDQLIYDVIAEKIDLNQKMYDNIYLFDPFSPNGGIHTYISTYFTDYRFDDKRDVEIYIELLKQFPDYFDECLEFEKRKSENNCFMSDANCDSVIEKCEDYVSGGDNHFLITTFDNSIKELSFLSDSDRAEFSKQNKDAVLNYVIPAFKNVISVMTELKGKGTIDGGICNAPGGKEYYEMLLKNRAGSSMSPGEVKQLLESKMQEHMQSLMTIAYSNPDAYQYFSENYSSIWEDVDSGMTPQEIIDGFETLFVNDYPQIGKIPYDVDYLDESLWEIEDGILAYYNSPAYDDEENNIIRINGKNPEGLWNTLAHEGIPGHMYQNAYFMSTNPHPIRDILASVGYKEGWAVYTSYNAYQYYDFNNSIYKAQLAKLCRLDSELSYLLIGIIDVNVNYFGWTVDDVQNYLDQNGYDGGAAENLFNTVTGDPATYQSYVTSYYLMQGLRDKAEHELGSKFDPVSFHKVILEAGPVSFDLLTPIVDKYIEESK